MEILLDEPLGFASTMRSLERDDNTLRSLESVLEVWSRRHNSNREQFSSSVFA